MTTTIRRGRAELRPLRPLRRVEQVQPDDAPDPPDPELENAIRKNRALRRKRAFHSWRTSGRVQLVCALWVVGSGLVVWQVAPTVEWSKGPIYAERLLQAEYEERLRQRGYVTGEYTPMVGVLP